MRVPSSPRGVDLTFGTCPEFWTRVSQSLTNFTEKRSRHSCAMGVVPFRKTLERPTHRSRAAIQFPHASGEPGITVRVLHPPLIRDRNVLCTLYPDHIALHANEPL